MKRNNLVNKTIRDNNFEPKQIFNFDESSFYMCSPGNYTIDYRGSKKLIKSSIILPYDKFSGWDQTPYSLCGAKKKTNSKLRIKQ
ncbi:hypothetical protein BpHYR1_049075 [Brachionus plicatilis]|uniref:Uncharacterized protein n=1 Tax=Brachionus plicatilis TaxID=10195 RepID=A0A3M7QAT5_BRAPC|nr:hypothetical protein BpHYR1_049075 [Brachionus plicatilis]